MQKRTARFSLNFVAILAVLATALPARAEKDSWRKIVVPTTASFRGLSAASAGVVWASGTGGTVIRTTDGGTSWSVRTVAGAEKLDFRGIVAFDAKTAVIMSSGNAEDGQARIYRTTDGGENWKLAYEQKTRGIFFDAIAFWDRDHGIVISDPVAGRFALFTTSNGGASWTQVPPEEIPAALPGEGAFAASNSCLAVEGATNVWFVTGGASVARVFRSTDRGQSWHAAETSMHPANASTGLFSLAFRDAKNGIAVGGDYARPAASPGPVVFVTSDGGATWRSGPATDPPGLFLSSVTYKPVAPGAKAKPGAAAAKSGAAAIAGGSAKAVATDSAESVASKSAEAVAAGTGGINSLNSRGQWTRESEQEINAVAFPTHDTGWAVGPKGIVLRFQ